MYESHGLISHCNENNTEILTDYEVEDIRNTFLLEATPLTRQVSLPFLESSVVDPNTLNLDLDPG